MPTYRFSTFIVSPARRMLLRDGREVPLIPRYFDLLVLLIERRHEAVHRRDIFDRVWTDVMVSDSALNQAVRTIRRALDDDPREPRFIRRCHATDISSCSRMSSRATTSRRATRSGT